MVELVERLLGKGHEIRIFDRNVNLSRLVGANRAYIYQHLPHIAKLMVDHVDEVVNHGGTIVIGNRDRYFSEVVGRLNMRATRGRSGSDRRRRRLQWHLLVTGRRVLIIVQNLPVPFDRRVWLEATSLTEAGYVVSVICPKAKGYTASFETPGRRRHLSLRASDRRPRRRRLRRRSSRGASCAPS